MKLVMEVIELEKLIQQCKLDIEKGATQPVTSASTCHSDQLPWQI